MQEQGLNRDHPIHVREPVLEREVPGPVVDLVIGGQEVVDQDLQGDHVHPEEGLGHGVDHQIWTVKDSMSLILTVMPPKETWKTSSLNMDLWWKSGWRGVFHVSRLLCLNAKRMLMRLVELLMVKKFVGEGSG